MLRHCVCVCVKGEVLLLDASVRLLIYTRDAGRERKVHHCIVCEAFP